MAWSLKGFGGRGKGVKEGGRGMGKGGLAGWRKLLALSLPSTSPRNDAPMLHHISLLTMKEPEGETKEAKGYASIRMTRIQKLTLEYIHG